MATIGVFYLSMDVMQKDSKVSLDSQASVYAQEGIEAVRNIRDSDWLLGASFNGTAGRTKNNVWGSELPQANGETRYYTVDFNQPSSLPVSSSLNLAAAAPWKLGALSVDEVKKGVKTLLYKQENVLLREIHYTHSVTRLRTRNSITQVTPFHRYIVISPVEYPLCRLQGPRCFKKMRVASVVEWQEFGQTKQVRLDTELTDWKDN